MHYLLMDDHMKRTTVLVEVFRCLCLRNGDEVSPGEVLAHVIGVLGVPEEEIGGHVYLAIIMLGYAQPIESNSPLSVAAGTWTKISPKLASWLLVGPAPYPGPDEDGEE